MTILLIISFILIIYIQVRLFEHIGHGIYGLLSMVIMCSIWCYMFIISVNTRKLSDTWSDNECMLLHKGDMVLHGNQRYCKSGDAYYILELPEFIKDL